MQSLCGQRTGKTISFSLSRSRARTAFFSYSIHNTSRFGTSDIYQVHPHNSVEATDLILKEGSTDLVLAYVLKTLPFEAVPDHAAEGYLKTLEEFMSKSGSSVVLPTVNFEERGTLLDRLNTLSEEVLVDRSRVSTDLEGKDFRDASDLSDDSSMSVVMIPVEAENLNDAIRDTESKFTTRSHVSVLSGRFAEESHGEEGGGQRRLMADDFTNTTGFDDYIYFSADSMSGILYALTMVWVLVLSVSCTMDIQCPTQIWTHANLPLKGRVEYE